MRPTVNKVSMASHVKLDTVRNVEEVSKRELVAYKIFLFAQNLLIDIELCAEGGDMLLNRRRIGF